MNPQKGLTKMIEFITNGLVKVEDYIQIILENEENNDDDENDEENN